MLSLIFLNILKCVVILLFTDSVVSMNCTNFKWADTDHNNYIWSIVGEWRVVDCSVEDNGNVDVALWLNQNKERTIHEKRITMVSKNVFNVTNLQLSDMGRYYCKACDNWKAPARINVKKGIPYGIPQITKRPNNTDSIVYGSPVTLECSLIGSFNDYEMIWFKVRSNKRYLKLQSRTRSIWSSDYNKKVQKEVLRISSFTKEDGEQYFCQVKRYAVDHVSRTFVHLHLQEMFKPVISNFSYDGNLIGREKEDQVVENHVTGTPTPDITWYESVDGKRIFISKCSGKTKTCSPISNKDIEVTMQTFVIKNASYIQHNNVTYICKATNVKGADEQNFTMIVNTKPRLTLPKSEIQLHKKNLSLECKLSKDANPTNISYSWAYCDKDVEKQTSCQNANDWNPLKTQNKNILKQDKDQEAGVRLYRCTAENGINKEQLIWTIVRPIGQHLPKLMCAHLAVVGGKSGEDKSGSEIEPIVIWQCLVAFLAILLLLTLFFAFRRRNQRKQDRNSICILKEKIGDSV